MDVYKLSKSDKKDKKYLVQTPKGRRIHFGAIRENGIPYEDYTTHKDPKRKKRYLKRHIKEDWNDPETAGFWATNILWNKPTLYDSIIDTAKKYDIIIEVI